MQNEVNYLVLTDNGGSDSNIYHDVTGILYTFPPSYKKMIKTGTKFIYHRPALKTEETPAHGRLSDKSHYFGSGEIGDVKPTSDGNYTADIIEYKPFNGPVYLYDSNGVPFEGANTVYQSGVRHITEENFNKIIKSSTTGGSLEKPCGGIRTKKNAKVILRSKSIKTKNGTDCQVVMDSYGYWLEDAVRGVYYPLKKVPSVPLHATSKEIKLLKSKSNYLIIHDNVNIGTLDPVDRGFKFTDSETNKSVMFNL